MYRPKKVPTTFKLCCISGQSTRSPKRRILIYASITPPTRTSWRRGNCSARKSRNRFWFRAARGRARPNVSWSRCRSEEHTSELQSLMHISYADFCLKKQNKTIFKYTVHYNYYIRQKQDSELS